MPPRCMGTMRAMRRRRWRTCCRRTPGGRPCAQPTGGSLWGGPGVDGFHAAAPQHCWQYVVKEEGLNVNVTAAASSS